MQESRVVAVREIEEHYEFQRGVAEPKQLSAAELKLTGVTGSFSLDAIPFVPNEPGYMADADELSNYRKRRNTHATNAASSFKKRRRSQISASRNRFSDDDDDDEELLNRIGSDSSERARVRKLCTYIRDGSGSEQAPARGYALGNAGGRFAGAAPAAGEVGAAASANNVFVPHAEGAGDQVEFVPLHLVSDQRLTKNAREYSKMLKEVFDSSCDELEEEVERQLADKEKRRRHSRACGHSSHSEATATASQRRRRGADESIATESLGDGIDVLFGGADGGTGGTDVDDSELAFGRHEPASAAPRGRGTLAKFSSGGGNRTIHSSMNCFLCRFGKREYDSVDKEDMNNLLRTLEEGIGHRNIYAHAKVVHKLFMETIYINAQARGEQLPVWRTWQVMEHILSHDLDPRTFIYTTICDLRRIAEELKNMLFVKDPLGVLTLHTKNYREFQNTIKMISSLYAARPEKMNFYNESSQIDLAKANKRVEGIVLQRTVEYYGNNNRKQY